VTTRFPEKGGTRPNVRASKNGGNGKEKGGTFWREEGKRSLTLSEEEKSSTIYSNCQKKKRKLNCTGEKHPVAVRARGAVFVTVEKGTVGEKKKKGGGQKREGEGERPLFLGRKT